MGFEGLRTSVYIGSAFQVPMYRCPCIFMKKVLAVTLSFCFFGFAHKSYVLWFIFKHPICVHSTYYIRDLLIPLCDILCSRNLFGLMYYIWMSQEKEKTEKSWYLWETICWVPTILHSFIMCFILTVVSGIGHTEYYL